MWYRVEACPAWNSPLVSGNSISVAWVLASQFGATFFRAFKTNYLLRASPLFCWLSFAAGHFGANACELMMTCRRFSVYPQFAARVGIATMMA
jgi:hypothetical protein